MPYIIIKKFLHRKMVNLLYDDTMYVNLEKNWVQNLTAYNTV